MQTLDGVQNNKENIIKNSRPLFFRMSGEKR